MLALVHVMAASAVAVTDLWTIIYSVLYMYMYIQGASPTE